MQSHDAPVFILPYRVTDNCHCFPSAKFIAIFILGEICAMKFLPMIVALFLAPHLAAALPYKDGILVVGDREFFVGEIAPTSNFL